MFAEERRSQILSLVSTQSSVSVKKLANRFKVSSATIRSDLNSLASTNKIQRTHGGAVAIDTAEDSNENISYQVRKEINIAEKKLIASKAMEQISDGLLIALDASSTCYELAKLIYESNLQLTIITNGIKTASLLKENLKLNVIIIGGIIKGESNAIEGLLGIDIFNSVHVDCFFFSSSGVSIDFGFSDFNLQEIELKKIIVQKSTRNIAMIDSSKFNKKSISYFAQFENVDQIISDSSLSKELIEKYQEFIDISIAT